MEKPLIFFSSQTWQPEKSDIIRKGLKKAIHLLAKNGLFVDYREASNNQTGSKLLLNVITQLIDQSFMLVGDVSNLGSILKPENYVTNPNVMFEVGYAIKSLGYDRVFLCYEGDYKIPSDIRGLQILQFNKDSADDLAQKMYTAILDLATKHMLYPVSDDARDKFRHILEYEWGNWVEKPDGMYYAIDPFFQVKEREYQVSPSFYMAHYEDSQKKGLAVDFIDKYMTLESLVVDLLDGRYQVPKPHIEPDFFGYRPLFFYCEDSLEFAYLVNKLSSAIHEQNSGKKAYDVYQSFLDEMVVFGTVKEEEDFKDFVSGSKGLVDEKMARFKKEGKVLINKDFRLSFEDSDPRHNDDALTQSLFQRAIKEIHTEYMGKKGLFDINATLLAK